MPIVEWFEFEMSGRVICAEHCVDSLGLETDRTGGTRALLVTDEGVEEAGLLEPARRGMSSGESYIAGVFNAVPQDSEIAAVRDCYKQAKRVGADCLISVGGGSCIDTAKAVAMLLVEGGDLLDFQGRTYIPSGPLPPHIAIPTTAGSGSETTSAAAVLDREQKLKLVFQAPDLAPRVALLDPVLTRTLSPRLTASTGMDALAHCIEGLHSRLREPIADGIALHGVRMVAGFLPIAVRQGKDMNARKYMLIASSMGGIVFDNAQAGIVRAMVNGLGGLCPVPHADASAILLPYCMEFNVSHYLESVGPPYRFVAGALGLDVANDDDEAAGMRAAQSVRQLASDLGLPQKLSEVGVPEGILERAAGDAMLNFSMENNAGEPDRDQVLELFRLAF